MLVLSGRCYEREDVPYKAIDGVIDALSHHLASISPSAAQDILPATAFVLAEEPTRVLTLLAAIVMVGCVP